MASTKLSTMTFFPWQRII